MTIILDFQNGLNLEIYSNMPFGNTEDILKLHNIYTKNDIFEFNTVYNILNLYLKVNKINYNWVGLAFM